MLETENLILNAAQFEDWQDMYNNLWRHDESARFMLWRPTHSEADAKSRMERTIAFQKEHPFAYTVYEKKSGKAIGFAGMTEIEPGVYEDIGIAVGPEFTGKGYGKQIVRALIGQAKEACGAVKFVYSCREKNIVSKNLARVCGFAYTHSEQKTDPRTGEDYVLEYFELKLNGNDSAEINYRIRTASIQDLEDIARIEAKCFPAAEAASQESLRKRLDVYPNHFWLLLVEESIAGFVNGMVTDLSDLADEMYENAALHNEEGKWQMIFGVDTLPEYRCHGYAGRLLRHVITQAELQGREGLVLTCKDKLIPYYEKFGFVREGISGSVHGGAVWYQMRLRFQQKLHMEKRRKSEKQEE